MIPPVRLAAAPPTSPGNISRQQRQDQRSRADHQDAQRAPIRVSSRPHRQARRPEFGSTRRLVRRPSAPRRYRAATSRDGRDRTPRTCRIRSARRRGRNSSSRGHSGSAAKPAYAASSRHGDSARRLCAHALSCGGGFRIHRNGQVTTAKGPSYLTASRKPRFHEARRRIDRECSATHLTSPKERQGGFWLPCCVRPAYRRQHGALMDAVRSAPGERGIIDLGPPARTAAPVRVRKAMRQCHSSQDTGPWALQPNGHQPFDNYRDPVDSRFCKALRYTGKTRRRDSRSTPEGQREAVLVRQSRRPESHMP